MAGKNAEVLTAQPVLEIRDAAGNRITKDSTTQITATLEGADAETDGTLVGSKVTTATAGITTFTDLALTGALDKAYRLKFTASGLDTPSVTSNQIAPADGTFEINLPTVKSVSVAPGTYGIGERVLITITATDQKTGLRLSSKKFNGQTLSAVEETKVTGTYTGIYTVRASDKDVADGETVVTKLAFTDATAGSTGPARRSVTLAGASIDTTTLSCYSPSAVGSLGTAQPCKDMLIVDRALLDGAVDEGADRYIDRDGVKYTFGDSAKNGDGHKNVFTGQVRDMSILFFNKTSFNADIGYWDVSRVAEMLRMFFGATEFNQDIGEWDTSTVVNMNAMFDQATEFNKNIGGWNVSRVTNMRGMFGDAVAFNQDLRVWNTTRVTDMTSMFYGATAFNQNIGTWDVSKVTDMFAMFYQASEFNQNIGTWDVSKVTDMFAMFYQASEFNQNIGTWDVSKVTDMLAMFY